MAFIPVRGYKADGKYPATEFQCRALFRNRRKNGLAAAFAQVGGKRGRVLIDPDRIEQLLGAQSTPAAARPAARARA
jgi:hypothetical protein